MNIDYQNTVQTLLGDKWAIMPRYLHAFMDLASRTTYAISDELIEGLEARAKPLRQVNGRVAVMPLRGVLTQRAGLFESTFFGASGTEAFGKQFDQAVKNNDIAAIVLDVDSPGGTVSGTRELANRIFAARGSKPIIAVANSLMASAAYWIATAADQVVASPSAEVGSVGVLAAHTSLEKSNEKRGIKVSYITSAPFKAEGNPDFDLSAEATESIQGDVNKIHDQFVEDLAKHRGLPPSTVRRDFGQGRVMLSDDAKAAGMVDRVATLDEILTKLNGRDDSRGSRRAKEEAAPIYSIEQARLERKNRARRRMFV